MQIVTAAILCKNGRYLLCQRGKNDALALKWEFPGGKLEHDETPEECLIREIKEELCLDIEVISHFCDTIYRHARGEMLLKAYLAEIIGGELNLAVHNAVVWVEAEKLLDYELLPADVEIAERVFRCGQG